MTPSTTATSAPTSAAGVPAACAADVRGEVFAQGTLEERLTRLRSYASSNAGRPITIVLTDTTLTEAVRQQLSGPNAPPVQDPTVGVRPDGVRFAATVTAAFFRIPISATLVPSVTGGRLSFVLRDLQAGGLPPEQVEAPIVRAADPAAWGLAMRVDDVVLRTGCGSVRGSAQA